MEAKRERILVVGAGWYGLHIARKLVELGYHVVVAEKNKEILSEVSGNFGVRGHSGLHYGRSKKTRENCQNCFEPFRKEYPDLIIPVEYSIYGLGRQDASFQPSKVKPAEFVALAKEIKGCKVIDPHSMDYSDEMIGALDVDEYFIAVGERLRTTFKAKYLSNKIDLRLNTQVFNIEPLKSGGVDVNFKTLDGAYTETFDRVINATCFESFYPKELMAKFNVKFKYQTLLAIRLQDNKPQGKPISLIVTDGWFPCIMPYPHKNLAAGEPIKDYILTHGSWTTQGSFKDRRDAQTLLETLNEHPLFVTKGIKELCFAEMERFWPGFNERFCAVGYKGAILPKLVTDVEFRSAVTFEEKNKKIIHIFPGKITNVIDAADEVLRLLQNENIKTQFYGGTDVIRYVERGVLDEAFEEMRTPPQDKSRSTTHLQSFQALSETFRHYAIRRTPSSPNMRSCLPMNSSTEELNGQIPGTASESCLKKSFY